MIIIIIITMIMIINILITILLKLNAGVRGAPAQLSSPACGFE